MKALLVAISLLVLTATAVQAQDPGEWIHVKRETTFSGAWVLERGVYAGLTIHLAITQDASTICIHQSTSLFQSDEKLKMDGTSEEHQVPYLGTVHTRTFWESNPTVLVTVTDLKAGDGKPAVATVRRSLADKGRTLVQELSLATSDGQTLRATRRFRKS